MSNNRLVLICTGLGRQQRGFEQYISALAGLLHQSGRFPALEVWSGGRWSSGGLRSRSFPHIPRDAPMLRGSARSFVWEQFSFFLAILPRLIFTPPRLIYLGEYRLYCWLYKFRAMLRLSYSLCLYTGGQAVAGARVFDPRRDYLHHVTPEFLADAAHIPAHRQFLLPHFWVDDFVYDEDHIRSIRETAAGRTIVLSVGLLDFDVKGMDKIIQALSDEPERWYPVLLGQASAQTPALHLMLLETFGEGNFVLDTLPHARLGDWYRAANVFVSASPRESFGLAMVEAMAHGLPVVARETVVSRWVLGPYAHLLNSLNRVEIKEAIADVALHNNDRLRMEATAYANDTFGSNKLAERYAGHFTHMLNGDTEKETNA